MLEGWNAVNWRLGFCFMVVWDTQRVAHMEYLERAKEKIL